MSLRGVSPAATRSARGESTENDRLVERSPGGRQPDPPPCIRPLYRYDSATHNPHMTAELPPRRAAFVAAYADPNSPTFGNGTQSAIAAGYSPTVGARAQAVEVLANPNVRASVRATLERAGISHERLAAGMLKYFEDEDHKVRASSVRAGEILMRASGMLEAETQVSVDARSVILPSAQSVDISALESLLAQIGTETESNPT